MLVSGTTGITINAAATDRIVLQGLDIEGLGTGIHGVNMIAGGTLYVIRCSIRHFTGNGVNLASSTANARAIIKDSFILFNAGGVNVAGNGVANVGSVINTLIDGNTSFAVQASGASNVVGVANSVLTGSPTGISLLATASAVSFGPSNIVSGAGAFTGAPIAFK